MNTLPLTPNNPYYSNFVQIIEPTILRYTKNGRWYEIHLETRMLTTFGYEKGQTFEDVSHSILHSIIYNFDNLAFDCTQEVSEEIEELRLKKGLSNQSHGGGYPFPVVLKR